MSETKIPKGYKKTEVGVIPADWTVNKFSDFSTCFSGGTPSTSNPRFYGGDVPWITSSDLNMVRIQSVQGRITKLGLEYSSAKMVAKGTLLLALYGATAGVSAITEIDGSINQAVLAILTKSVNTEFLFQFLRHNKEYFITTFTQGGQPNFSGGIVKSFLIPLPPLPEQLAIATALSDVDALIAGLDQLIAKKRDLKQAAMQQLLTGQKRLPGFQIKSGYKQTEVGMIPEDWEVKQLPEVAWFQEGPGLRQWQFTKSGMKVINVTNLEKGLLNLERTDRHISIKLFLKMYPHFAIDSNDFVMASSGNSYGKLALVRSEDLPLVMNTSVIRFKSNENYYSNLLWQLLGSPMFKDQIDLMITGGAQPNFGPYHLKRINVPFPPFSEQTAIATILSDMDSELAALEQRRDKTRALKQGMMQELLTGKTRLI